MRSVGVVEVDGAVPTCSPQRCNVLPGMQARQWFEFRMRIAILR